MLGAARLPVTDAASAAALMSRASEARACEATAMNASSSRSHCVFMLYIAASHAATGTQLSGSLCLVDLAGRCDLVLGMSAQRSVPYLSPHPPTSTRSPPNAPLTTSQWLSSSLFPTPLCRHALVGAV